MDCHIQGLGACMIGGFPHRTEDSFFHHAIERLRTDTPHQITSSLYTFGGFPITRVPKHLKPRCLDARPDIVVLQFASSDLVVPIRRKHDHHHGQRPVHHEVTTRTANTRDLWRWRLQGLIGDLRQLTPVTPVETYLQTLQQIISSLREHNITPVVISPFVFGGWRSDRIARSAAGQLRQLLASKPDIFYVDAYAALDRHPRRKMLLHDGTHLTLAGQQVVANALLPALKQAVDHRHNTAANSPA